MAKLLEEPDYVFLRTRHFEVDLELGSGGFGVVVRAQHTSPTSEQSTCAIKAAKYVNNKDLIREARFGQYIRHFHCLNSHHYFANRGIFYIVMDYCPGGSLANYLANHPLPRRSYRRIQQFGKELGSALHYLHHADIAHRDVKPENILLDGQRRIKLCDYGLAKCVDSSLRNTNCGTKHYKPPELFSRFGRPMRPETDPFKHDVWGFGAVVFEMLTGELPFTLGQLEKQPRFGNLNIDPPLGKVSDRDDDTQQVLRNALNVEYNERSSMCDLMRMPWLSGYEAPPPPPRPEL